ncbi:MAG: TAXI family TRAP transporter solute-binding subunit [Candidatus Riflebacteria bacterium]|nr:TAXI family TRAP transporter solute-binding subunit [Candidatus Riflebacteria bacterium]
MKRVYLLIALIPALLVLTGLAGCGGSDPSRTEYTIATGSKSGVYFPIGEALAVILKKTFPNVTLKVLETGGSVENLQLLRDGKVDMALVQNDIAFYAAEGEAMFNGQKISNISGIATLFPEVVQIIVRKETGIKTLADMAGHKIAVGNKDSGTFYNAQQLLTIAKVWEQIDQQYINAGEAMKEMQEGRIDGFIFTSGMPNPSIVELARKVEVNLVPVDPDLVQKLVNTYSFYYPSTIEANQYPGQTEEISAVEINAILLSGTTLSENDQYLMTKYLFGQPNELGESHPRLSKMTKNSLRRQMPVQLGKGAYKAHSEVP